jgi:hypothetical protein
MFGSCRLNICAENVELVLILCKRIFEQVTQQLHRHVLERKRGTVRQRLQDERLATALFKYAQRRDGLRVVALANVAVDLCGVGAGSQRLQVVGRNIGRELAQDLVSQVRVGQLAPGVELGAGDLRVFGRKEQAAVRGQAAEENVGEALLVARGRLRGCACGDVMHKVKDPFGARVESLL